MAITTEPRIKTCLRIVTTQPVTAAADVGRAVTATPVPAPSVTPTAEESSQDGTMTILGAGRVDVLAQSTRPRGSHYATPGTSRTESGHAVRRSAPLRIARSADRG